MDDSAKAIFGRNSSCVISPREVGQSGAATLLRMRESQVKADLDN
jgi:hypothetical protein